MRLYDLPLELQYSIIELLPTKDIYSLNLVSKSSRVHSERALYSAVHLTAPRSRALRIKPLIQTLISRPELAQHVQKLSLQEWGYNIPRQCTRVYPQEDEEYNQLKLDPDRVFELCSWTSKFEPAPWLNSLKHLKSTDAELALLLSTLPNLESLDLRLNFPYGTKILGQMLRAAVCQTEDSNSGLHRFQHLRRIYMSSGLSGYCQPEINDNADILPFFYMPAVADLCMPIPNSEDFTWPTHAPSPSTLLKLRLTRIREDRLEPVLSVLTDLKKLTWVCTYLNGYDDLLSQRQINLTKIGTAMSLVRNTLEDLKIIASVPVFAMGRNAPELTLHSSLNGFNDMVCLKRLSMPWVFAMGLSPNSTSAMVNLIPSSLESIKFTGDLMRQRNCRWDSDSIFSVLKSWVEAEMTCSHALRVIELKLYIGRANLDGSWCDRVRLLKAQAPITFVMSGMRSWGDDGESDYGTVTLKPKY